MKRKEKEYLECVIDTISKKIHKEVHQLSVP